MNHGNLATTMCKAECYWSFVVTWGEFGHVTVHSLFHLEKLSNPIVVRNDLREET